MQERLEAKITGRVQMVMFRDFSQRKARRLGLVGTVQNMPNGSVSVVAEGKREDLEKFLVLLHKGSILSRVENVNVVWGVATGEFTDFKIVF